MNFLPELDRKRVVAEQRNRALLIGAVTSLFVAGVAFLALLPATLVSYEQRVQDEFAALESRSDQLRKDRVEAQEAQELIAALLPIATSTTRVPRVIEQALSLRPSGVLVEAVSYSGGEVYTAIISGVSESRDALNAYRAALDYCRGV